MQDTAGTQTYAFTAAEELEWLTSFQAAVAAGLFSEWELEPQAPESGESGTTDTHYPSDPRDITRLLTRRRAVATTTILRGWSDLV
jgi:hypothetical protein